MRNFQENKNKQPAHTMQIHPDERSELVIGASILKMLWLVALLGAFAFLAIFSIFLNSFWGWIGAIILVPLFILSLYVYRPSATYLRLNWEGAEIVNMGRLFKLKWSDVEGFHVVKNRGDSQIGILFTETYLEQNRAYFIQDPDRAWIRDLYTVSTDSLCEILNQCRSPDGRLQLIAIGKNQAH